MVDKLKLICGLPVNIEIGYIYPPKIKDIANIGEQEFYKKVSVLNFNKKVLELENEDLDDYDILVAMCLYDEKFKISFEDAFKFFIKENVTFAQGNTLSDMGYFFIGKIEENRKIDKNNFFEIVKTIKDICFIKEKKEEKVVAGNEKARQFMERLKKKNEKLAKLNKKEELSMSDIISSIAWKSGIAISTILEMTIFQLYDAFMRLNIITDYENTMFGVYTGNIDTKKIDIKKMTWYKNANVE